MKLNLWKLTEGEAATAISAIQYQWRIVINHLKKVVYNASSLNAGWQAAVMSFSLQSRLCVLLMA